MPANLGLRVSSNVAAIVADIRGSGLTTEQQNRAAARGLNRAAERGRTAAAREISKKYKIKYGKALDTIVVQHASADRLEVSLVVRGRPLSLGNFTPRQTKKGVSVNIKGVRKLIRGAFVRTLVTLKGDEATSYNVVFVRAGKDRYPLKALKTVDLPGAFSREEVQRIVDAAASDSFDAEFVRQLELLLNRKVG